LFLDESEAQQQNYALQKFQTLANECLNSVANSVRPKIKEFNFTVEDINQDIEMPADFLSFADLVNYVDDCPEPEIIYITDRVIRVKKKGTYRIFYNAYYPIIDILDVREDRVLDIEASVLNLLPTYIAWNILSQDDPQRSMILKNEYELLLARLDNSVMNQAKHYRSEGG
jgi:hypothetical protein